MSTPVLDRSRGATPERARRLRTRPFALPEVRWATLATALFALGLAAHFGGAPAWWSWTLFGTCYSAGGWEPALAGLRALRERTLDVDLLMIVAAIGAAAIGQVLDGGLLIVIFATSGALDAFLTQRTADSVRSLLDLAPERATVLDQDSGTETVVATATLAVGDLIVVRPGERIGADGEVIAGASDVDQASITGEPLPLAKHPGDEVFAGTLNGTGTLRVEVGRAAADTVVARIVAMVAEASATKATAQVFIERVEQYYSLAVVAATVAVFAIPLASGTALQEALLRAMTFMIVASPCALVLATMPPLLAAMATAGRNGVLVKSAVVMERLGSITAVAFDKTGTLTQGSPRLTDVRELGSRYDADAILRWAAAAEHPSEHPLACAIVTAATDRGLTVPTAEEFESLPGRGVRAVLDGLAIEVGSPTAFPRDELPASELAGWEAAGRTVVVVRVDDVPVGLLAMADRLRPGAAETVAALTALTGTGAVLLTGDNVRAARALGDDVGIGDVRAGLLPQDKVTAVRELEDGGQWVLLVGDGVNDAPALAAAHTGVAMGRSGSDLALETAGTVIVRDDLSALPAVIALSRRARRIVWANLVVATVFITGLVLWDLVGHLPLPLGVAGHEGSTIVVGLNGMRLLAQRAWLRADQRHI